MPPTIKDDDHLPQATTAKVKPAMIRVTVANAIAAEELATKAKKKPESLPALVFPKELQMKVIITKGAMLYDKETTCIIEVRPSDETSFLNCKTEDGIFIMK